MGPPSGPENKSQRPAPAGRLRGPVDSTHTSSESQIPRGKGAPRGSTGCADPTGRDCCQREPNVLKLQRRPGLDCASNGPPNSRFQLTTIHQTSQHWSPFQTSNQDGPVQLFAMHTPILPYPWTWSLYQLPVLAAQVSKSAQPHSNRHEIKADSISETRRRAHCIQNYYPGTVLCQEISSSYFV